MLAVCIFFPHQNQNIEVEIFMWVRKSEFDKGLDQVLFKTVKSWVEEKWPFKKSVTLEESKTNF